MKPSGSSWKFALIFLSGIIVAAQLLFIVHWRWHFWQSEHWSAKLPPQWVAIESGSEDGGRIVQEKICPREQSQSDEKQQPAQQRHKQYGQCYVVSDGPSAFGTGFSRSLTMESHKDILLAESDLDFPLHYKFTRKNARQWSVLTNKVTVDYQKVIIAQPFITQTFAPSLTPWKVLDGKVRRILCLGLRGSSVNNFFSTLSTKYEVTVVEPDPAIHYIAKKWFGFEETEHHRILVENPVFYLTARARLIEHPKMVGASQFHFIVVDVCHGLNSKSRGKCPFDEFEEEKTVKDLSINLIENGTIVVNNFSLDSKSDIPAQHQLANRERRMLQLYQKYFTHCFFVNITSNLILTCSRKGPMTRLHYHLAYRKLPKDLQTFTAEEEPKFFLDLEAT
uniref:Methyltranfer_dom domain-containing protein n=1 Tax=Globodera pallida TaxID=36090 RepID=A0A183BIV0_GLOPA